MDEDEVEKSGPFRFTLHDIMVPGLVAIIVALIVSLATVFVVKAGQDNTIDQSAAAAARQGAAAAVKAITKTQVVACGRTQVTRGLNRFQIESATSIAPDLQKLRELTVAYDQILDCRLTYAGRSGRAAPLPAPLQKCFVALVGRGYFIENDPETDAEDLSKVCAAEKLP